MQNYNGQPYWSPDLSRLLLVVTDNQARLTLRDEQTGEELPLGIGYSPIWADNENLIYLRFLKNADPILEGGLTTQVLTASVNDPLDARLLVDSADIAAALPDNEPAAYVGIQSVIAHPNQPGWLLLVADIGTEAGSRAIYLLALRQDTGQLEAIFNSDRGSLLGLPQITPDGRYLTLQTVGISPSGPSPVRSLTLIPLDSADRLVGEPVEIYEINLDAYHDWSQDGSWLLVSGQGFVRLIAPGYDYDQEIRHNMDTCQEALWINP